MGKEITIDVDQLKNIIQRSVTQGIIDFFDKKNNKPDNSSDDFISAEQAANFLKIKINTIYSKVEKGDLPHYRSGERKLLFSRKELVDYIQKRKG